MYLALIIEADSETEVARADLLSLRDALVSVSELVPMVGFTASRLSYGKVTDLLNLIEEGQLFSRYPYRAIVMIGTRVIPVDSGFQAVAELSDGTLSTPLGAPIRTTRILAQHDCGRIVMRDGPIFDSER